MRLLFVCKHNPQDPSEKALRSWLPRLVGEFREFVFRPQERRRFDPQNMIFSMRIKAMVENFRPTHIFCWLPYLNPEELEWCKQLGIKLIVGLNGFATFSTGLYKDQSLYFESLRQLDVYLVPHRPHIQTLLKHGIRAVEMPFFYDPEAYRPLSNITKFLSWDRADLFFVGNLGDSTKLNSQSAYRKQAIEMLGKIARVKVMSDYSNFSEYIKYLKPTASDRLINWHVNSSRASICFDYFPDINDYDSLGENVVQRYDGDYKYAVRPRVLTMMGAGTPVFIDRHPEIQRMFVDGQDVVMWSGLNELHDRFNYYLSSPGELKDIAQNGYKKVVASHNVEKRLLETIMPAIVG